jgi:hypothetical protein
MVLNCFPRSKPLKIAYAGREVEVGTIYFTQSALQLPSQGQNDPSVLRWIQIIERGQQFVLAIENRVCTEREMIQTVGDFLSSYPNSRISFVALARDNPLAELRSMPAFCQNALHLAGAQ